MPRYFAVLEFTGRARTLAAGLLSVLALFALLALGGGRAAHADDNYLDPDAAFKFSARMVDGHTVAVTYQIADGYYMYRERFKFTAAGAQLGAPAIPPGKIHFDDTFQKNVETYRGSVTITIPVDTAGSFVLSSTGQGCSDKGLCYAPITSKATLTGSGSVPLPAAPSSPAAAAAPVAQPVPLATGAAAGAAKAAATVAASASAATVAAANNAADAGPSAPVTPGVHINTVETPRAVALDPAEAAPVAAAATPAADDDQGRIASVLKSGNLLLIVPAFLVFGLLLSYTPCVLPMVPILSSIIVGEGQNVSRMRGLLLSATYALGMALVYTALGVAAGLIGEGLAGALQNPWVLGAFAVLMALLSLSMFGFYELQVPAFVQEKLSSASNRQSSGKLVGVFVMGAISALIVGPCVAAPLAGALLYIGQSRDVVIGGTALFSLAVGMSVPLLLVGVSAGTLLPRAGVWMEQVKRFFGVLLLGTALWLVSPVLPGLAQMLGWTVLLVGYGVYMLMSSGRWVAKSVGLVCAVLGLVQLVGAASGGRDPLAPLAQLQGSAQAAQAPTFKRIKTVAELDAVLAQTGGKTALLDFYADWCVSCKEMEKLTFVDPQVRAKMANSILLQVDVTANDADDQAMLKRFHLFGPPGIILFDAHGQELAGARIIGFQDAPKFLAALAPLN